MEAAAPGNIPSATFFGARFPLTVPVRPPKTTARLQRLERFPAIFHLDGIDRGTQLGRGGCAWPQSELEVLPLDADGQESRSVGCRGVKPLLEADSGPDLPRGSGAGEWKLEREPMFLESSVPGLFVAGDVRHGSIKRVASALGEGAMAVTLVHRYLSSLEAR
jgi:hypothetical protein